MNLQEVAEWVEGIYQLEIEDLVQGGAEGVDNLQAKQLANRTAYLKAQVEKAFLRDGTDVLEATVDWDTYTVSGFYQGTGMANAPRASADAHFVAVLNRGTLGLQMAFPADYEAIWVRVRIVGGWSEWERIGQTSTIDLITDETYDISEFDDRSQYVSGDPLVKTVFNLPAITHGGMRLTFVRGNAAGLRVQAPVGVSINDSPPGGHVEASLSSETLASITLLAVNDAQWIAVAGHGVWHESRSGGVDAIRSYGIVTNSAETTPVGGDFSVSVNLV